jgi:hypothetical protein
MAPTIKVAKPTRMAAPRKGGKTLTTALMATKDAPQNRESRIKYNMFRWLRLILTLGPLNLNWTSHNMLEDLR